MTDDARSRIAAEMDARAECDSDLKMCCENWPDDPESWCYVCLLREAAAALRLRSDSELFTDHSIALAFVREIADGECPIQCGNCIRCRAQRWLFTEQDDLTRGAMPGTAETVARYRVVPDESGGEWHELLFGDGRKVMIFTDRPLVIVEAERH